MKQHYRTGSRAAGNVVQELIQEHWLDLLGGGARWQKGVFHANIVAKP